MSKEHIISTDKELSYIVRNGEKVMTCKNCGKEFEGNFCPSCGERFDVKSSKRASKNGGEAKSEHTGRKKSKKIIIIIALVVVAALSVLIAFLFPILGEKNQATVQLKNDLTNTIESMLGKNDTNEIYISGLTFLNETSYQVLMDNDVGNKIGELIEYSIENVDITDAEATVVINVKSPDVYLMICQIVENKNASDTDSLLKELLSQLNKECQTTEKNISCNLKYENGHWYLMPDTELSNILSGNLYEYYANLGKNTVDELTGGINNEE